MKVKEVVFNIEELAPIELAADFDNVGLIVGNDNDEVSGVVVCVDVTRDIIEEAIYSHSNLIISHHPIIFSPIKKLVNGNYISEIIMLAVMNKINLYASHTNMDKAVGGINDVLADMFGGYSLRSLEEGGCGTIGDIDEMTAISFIDVVSTVVGGNIQVFGDYDDRVISTFAVISGAGGRDDRLPSICRDAEIDIFITGELKHNLALEFIDRNIIVIEFNHYESEKVFIDIAANLLAQKDIKVLKCY